MIDELAVVRMYLTPENNKKLNDVFQNFADVETPDSEALVIDAIQQLERKFPQFVYLPFIKIYNAMCDARHYR